MYSEKIAACRTGSGLSQRALGEMLGVSAAAVYKWEHGQSQPDITSLKKMATIFGVTVDELVGQDSREESGNIAVMARAFRQMTPEEQEKYLAVGRTLFADAFGEGKGGEGR